MFCRVFILISFIFLTIACTGQTVEAFNLKNENFYSEYNTFSFDSLITIKQQVCYDAPNMDDEEYCINFFLKFNNQFDPQKTKTLDLNKDTSLVKCVFNIRDPWGRDQRPIRFSGLITILSWTTKSIKLEFNTTVLDKNQNKKYRYKGVRTFKKL